MTTGDSALGCCVGEPGFGDPNGLHSLDCPAYQAFVEAWIDRQPKPEPRRDPSTETWREAVDQSTSARLRQVQRDLAASQQDLTHVHHQLACAESDRMKAECERDEARAELMKRDHGCAWRTLAVTAMRERAYARAQLDDAIAAMRAEMDEGRARGLPEVKR
jgi:hypothetical protein